MTGAGPAAAVGAHGGPALEARAAGKRFAGRWALRGLTLAVGAGELYGLVGPDGAGKTTAVRALAGLVTLDEGEARVLGRDARRGGAAVREALGLMPQQYSLYRDLTVAENLRFFGRLYLLPRAVYRERVERLLALTRLAPFTDRRADALSGGMYKKLALACALLHEPRVLLLDEPTSGVDPVSRRELWRLLHAFVDGGMSVLVTTPYMDEAERCGRVGLLHEGRLVLEGPPRTLLAGLADEVFLASGGERDRVEAALSTLSPVRAVAPSGGSGGVRVAVAPGAGPEVAARLAPLGATLHRTAPVFEDLFLAATRAEPRA